MSQRLIYVPGERLKDEHILIPISQKKLDKYKQLSAKRSIIDDIAVTYSDDLNTNPLVIKKISYRGNGNSEGSAYSDQDIITTRKFDFFKVIL